MIDPSACDLCHCAMTAQFFDIQLVRGTMGALIKQRWSVVARPGGIQQHFACRICVEEILTAVRQIGPPRESEHAA